VVVKREIFLGGCQTDLLEDIAKWEASDHRIFKRSYAIMSKTLFIREYLRPGEELSGSGDWVAIVEYEQLP
jgi:hypothetical protein